MRPATQFLKTKSHKCFFSYPYNMTTFQTGYLGIGPSKISGGFHLRYPISNPINVSRIEATLVGHEMLSNFAQDDLKNTKNTFYSQTQCIYQSITPTNSSSRVSFTPITSIDLSFEFHLDDDIPPSYSSSSPNSIFNDDMIKYKVKITIFRQRNFLKLQGKNKNISIACQIDRYSLPSVLKSPNQASLHRSETNKQNSNPLLDAIIYKATLTSKYIDMNSIMVLPLTLILPNPKMKIKEIDVVIKERQRFKNSDKEIIYFKASNKILEYKLSGDCIELVDESINEYFVEMKMDVPCFESVCRFQAHEGVRPLKYFKVKHILKIKVKFENGDQLVLEEFVWLQRSLSERKIFKGRERGYIN
ncbi:18525_t:CDS:1 [Funneliformis geosporum]|uniref:3267_t:CDS:1 n=1 Tax=Funneliformis geosporum TaxID=1117311 RepID=A0A9W4WV34_9GLOM|nr:3267_t:CDS:1 [Funneliformis geosporum]CAI2167285.1 18525_t:CDS:1 [Funneliformis geosporum]